MNGDTDDGDNQVSGTVAGPVVQAHSIQGNVHFHQPHRAPVVPRQLPGAAPHFVGRRAELEALTRLQDQAVAGPGTVVISAINGTAGIGKTALAVYWARQAADHFPDGQLYVNLRGFAPTSTPMQPAEAVRGFLDAFEIPPERIPISLDGQTALYRSLLAERRVLVVLDNAHGTHQVRPLLPGSSTCLVVITSRNRLTGLVAQEGARPVILDVLTDQEATVLLTRFLGQQRITAEPKAVAELIEHCGRLPLALAIMAARAATSPEFPLGALADDLKDEQTRLDALDTGDPATSVRAVFSWSYHALTTQAAHLFRLLGLHPGPTISRHAATSLAGVLPSQARTLLAELTQANLLDEDGPGQFRLHNLLHGYAAEQATAEEPEYQRRMAIHRVLDYYLHTGFAANQRLYPQRDPIVLETPQPGVTIYPMQGYQQAMDWFAAEYAPLLAVTYQANRARFDTHAWQLPWTLVDFFNRQGHWHDWAATHEVALAAASRLGDRAAQARTHRILGHAYRVLGRYSDALTHLRQALTMHQELGDSIGEARTHRALSWVYERQDRCTQALTHAQLAVGLYEAIGHRAGLGRALNALGWNHARLGHYQQALTHCQHALCLLREIGDRNGEAHTLGSLGYAHHNLGQYNHAIVNYRQSIALRRELGDYYNEANVLIGIGDTYYIVGSRSEARNSWLQALKILNQLAHSDAEQIRAKLAKLGYL